MKHENRIKHLKETYHLRKNPLFDFLKGKLNLPSAVSHDKNGHLYIAVGNQIVKVKPEKKEMDLFYSIDFKGDTQVRLGCLPHCIAVLIPDQNILRLLDYNGNPLAGETYGDSKWWEKKDIKKIRDEYFKDNWRTTSTKIRECKKVLKRTQTGGLKLVDNPFAGIEKIKKNLFNSDNDTYLKNIIKIFLETCKKNNFRVLVNGAGGHTRTLFDTTAIGKANIGGIGDKCHKGNRFLQYKLYPMEELQESHADVLLISSEAYQGQMENDLYRIYGNNLLFYLLPMNRRTG